MWLVALSAGAVLYTPTSSCVPRFGGHQLRRGCRRPSVVAPPVCCVCVCVVHVSCCRRCDVRVLLVTIFCDDVGHAATSTRAGEGLEEKVHRVEGACGAHKQGGNGVNTAQTPGIMPTTCVTLWAVHAALRLPACQVLVSALVLHLHGRSPCAAGRPCEGCPPSAEVGGYQARGTPSVCAGSFRHQEGQLTGAASTGPQPSSGCRWFHVLR